MCDNCRQITLAWGGKFKDANMMTGALYPIYYALEDKVREELRGKDATEQYFEFLMIAKWNEYARLN